MQTQQHPSTGDRLGRADHEVHAAVRFAVLSAVAGLAFLIVAALWDSTCQGAMSIDTVACGAPQLTILAFGAPLILLAAGIWGPAADHPGVRRPSDPAGRRHLGLRAYLSRLA
jgi:chromate transport protein ChrA